MPRLPTIWKGAEYINKNAPNNYTWNPPCVEYGEVAKDVNKGRKGEMGCIGRRCRLGRWKRGAKRCTNSAPAYGDAWDVG